MDKFNYRQCCDLTTPDGFINEMNLMDDNTAEIEVLIKEIHPSFIGFFIDQKYIFFNLKSTLAQIGFNSTTKLFYLSEKNKRAEIKITIHALSSIAKRMLKHLSIGMYVGKLFAAPEERKVRDPNYLMRMFGRCDRNGLPLLSLSCPNGRDDLILDKINDSTVAFLPLKKGVVSYSSTINNFLPTLGLMLKNKKYKIREILGLHQKWNENRLRKALPGKILLVKTQPLYIRTVFAKVADHLLPAGFSHTSACILEPDTTASGNIYELYGSSENEITEIPLEFYTLEPHKEYVFFEDRDQLQSYLEDPKVLFESFETAPKNVNALCSTFICKGTEIANLSKSDWIAKEVVKQDFPGLNQPSRQALLVEKYIEQQPCYKILEAIEKDQITSQGILLNKYFPSPLMKRMLLSTNVQRCIKGIYFKYPSHSNFVYFSHEDRAFLLDLAKFGIPVYWVDDISQKILKYTVKEGKDAGMFVPLDLVETFKKATFFGVYGSNLIEGNFENELNKLLSAIKELRKKAQHPLLNEKIPLGLITGGGPGAMEVGNRVAKKLDILSCANIVDFRPKDGGVVNEQIINPHIDAKMTYRLDRLVERQAEFHLDFPIFLQGGIGSDFEYSLEEVTRKIGAIPPTPMLLFGEPKYWKDKIRSRFQCNLKSGTIKGSEWLSNCFYCIQTAEQGIKVYEKFFTYQLPIGKQGPYYEDGFCIVD